MENSEKPGKMKICKYNFLLEMDRPEEKTELYKGIPKGMSLVEHVYNTRIKPKIQENKEKKEFMSEIPPGDLLSLIDEALEDPQEKEKREKEINLAFAFYEVLIDGPYTIEELKILKKTIQNLEEQREGFGEILEDYLKLKEKLEKRVTCLEGKLDIYEKIIDSSITGKTKGKEAKALWKERAKDPVQKLVFLLQNYIAKKTKM